MRAPPMDAFPINHEATDPGSSLEVIQGGYDQQGTDIQLLSIESHWVSPGTG